MIALQEDLIHELVLRTDAKLAMIVTMRILKRILAEGLRFTTQENRWLTDHYNNYPESPDGFEAWSTKLRTRIADANTKLERFCNTGT